MHGPMTPSSTCACGRLATGGHRSTCHSHKWRAAKAVCPLMRRGRKRLTQAGRKANLCLCSVQPNEGLTANAQDRVFKI